MIAVDLKAKRFGEVTILGKIGFTVDAKQTLAITGPSGIGKTTLLRIIAGLDEAFEGNVVRPDRIAMVFQEPTLLPWRSALDNIVLATSVDTGTAEAVLGEVGLSGLSERFPTQLSLGQQRRLALARALAAEPDLLLMDEPFVSLDAELIVEMLELTERLLASRQAATLLVTHSRQEAERLADRVIRLGGDPAAVVEDRQA